MPFYDTEIIERLPSNIRFGTSSWTYSGWKDQIYFEQYKNEKEFNRSCLKEYAECPLFQTVGIDRTFYSPPSKSLLSGYASQLPSGFQWVSKVWERLTIPRYPKHPRYGRHAGTTNEHFLDPELFITEVLPAFQDETVLPYTGPLVFQFPTIWPSIMDQETFLERLQSFLRSVPGNFQYAVEIRNRDWLSTDYFAVLNEAGATHCFNHWSSMPPLAEQMRASAQAGGLTAPFYVTRILTPLGMSYQEAVNQFQPYRKLQQPNPEMRRDVVRLIKRAIQKNVPAFVIVNNRSEGNAPLTIDAITRMAVDA